MAAREKAHLPFRFLGVKYAGDEYIYDRVRDWQPVCRDNRDEALVLIF